VKLTVQYIPLSKIKPDLTMKITDHVKKFRSIMWDCMHILVVRKNRNDGSYTIVSGHDRLEYLQKNTKMKFAPCIIDESSTSTKIKHSYRRVFNKQIPKEFKNIITEKITPKSLAIIRKFLMEDPRFRTLSRGQQLRVLFLAIRYKKTVVSSMKKLVGEIQTINNGSGKM
jgi:hypothetical protein